MISSRFHSLSSTLFLNSICMPLLTAYSPLLYAPSVACYPSAPPSLRVRPKMIVFLLPFIYRRHLFYSIRPASYVSWSLPRALPSPRRSSSFAHHALLEGILYKYGPFFFLLSCILSRALTTYVLCLNTADPFLSLLTVLQYPCPGCFNLTLLKCFLPSFNSFAASSGSPMALAQLLLFPLTLPPSGTSTAWTTCTATVLVQLTPLLWQSPVRYLVIFECGRRCR